jgi:hypothetical protein
MPQAIWGEGRKITVVAAAVAAPLYALCQLSLRGALLPYHDDDVRFILKE